MARKHVLNREDVSGHCVSGRRKDKGTLRAALRGPRYERLWEYRIVACHCRQSRLWLLDCATRFATTTFFEVLISRCNGFGA